MSRGEANGQVFAARVLTAHHDLYWRAATSAVAVMMS